MLNPQLSHSNSLDISNLEYNLVTTQSEPYLNMEISIEEVSEVIYSLDDNKSPGPDGLGTSTIKNPIAIEYLHKLYNFCFKNSEISHLTGILVHSFPSIKVMEANTIQTIIEELQFNLVL